MIRARETEAPQPNFQEISSQASKLMCIKVSWEIWRSKRLCLAVRLISSSWNILGETILGSEDCSRMIGIECKECYGLDRIRSELLVIYVCTPLLGTEGFLGGTSGKEPACQCKRRKRCSFDPWVRKIPWRKAQQSTPVFLPWESHGQRSLVGYESIESQRVGHD